MQNHNKLREDLKQFQAKLNTDKKTVDSLISDVKLCGRLLETPVDNSYELAKVLSKFRQHGEDSIYNEEVERLASILEEQNAKYKEELVFKVGQELKEVFAQKGLEITGRNPEYRVKFYTIKTDFEGGFASIVFAREILASRILLKPISILQAYEKVDRQLCNRKFNPEAFIKELFTAYSRVLKLRGEELGKRANIVEVLDELAFLMQSDRFRVNPSKENFRGYARAFFSYDLNQLREHEVLSFEGMRLNLGVATIDHSENPKKSIFLTDGKGGGKFIMYVTFVKEDSNGAHSKGSQADHYEGGGQR